MISAGKLKVPRGNAVGLHYPETDLPDSLIKTRDGVDQADSFVGGIKKQLWPYLNSLNEGAGRFINSVIYLPRNLVQGIATQIAQVQLVVQEDSTFEQEFPFLNALVTKPFAPYQPTIAAFNNAQTILSSGDPHRIFHSTVTFVGDHAVSAAMMAYGMPAMMTGVKNFATSSVSLAREGVLGGERLVLRGADAAAKGLRKIGVDVGNIGGGSATVTVGGRMTTTATVVEGEVAVAPEVVVSGGADFGNPLQGALAPMAMAVHDETDGKGKNPKDDLTAWKEKIRTRLTNRQSLESITEADIEMIAGRAESLFAERGGRRVIGSRDSQDQPVRMIRGRQKATKDYTIDSAIEEAIQWYKVEKPKIFKERLVSARKTNDVQWLTSAIHGSWDILIRILTRGCPDLIAQLITEKDALIARGTNILKNRADITKPIDALQIAAGKKFIETLPDADAFYAEYVTKVTEGNRIPLPKDEFLKGADFPNNPVGKFTHIQQQGIRKGARVSTEYKGQPEIFEVIAIDKNGDVVLRHPIYLDTTVPPWQLTVTSE